MYNIYSCNKSYILLMLQQGTFMSQSTRWVTHLWSHFLPATEPFPNSLRETTSHPVPASSSKSTVTGGFPVVSPPADNQNDCNKCTNVFSYRKGENRASLVAQWLRIHLPMQATRVRALVREDPTCCRATKPVPHNYWACEPQLLKPTHLEPVLHNKRSHRNEKPAHCNEE